MLRKVKKAVLTSLLAVLMLVSLCSCMAMEMGLEFLENGLVRIYSTVTMEESMLSTLGTTKEEYINSLKESEDSEEYEGWESETVEMKKGDKNYIGIRYYKDVTYDEVTNIDDAENAEYNIEKKDGQINVTIKIKPGEEVSGDSSQIDQMIAEGQMSAVFCITAPYELVETNGSIDGETRKITWDITEVMAGKKSEMTLTASFEAPPEFPVGIIIAVCAAVVVIVVVIVVVLNNKKPKLNAVSYIQPETAIPEMTVAEEPTPVPTIPEEMPDVPETSAVTEEASVPEETAEKPMENKFCSNCGNKLKPDAQFCQNCGERVN